MQYIDIENDILSIFSYISSHHYVTWLMVALFVCLLKHLRRPDVQRRSVSDDEFFDANDAVSSSSSDDELFDGNLLLLLLLPVQYHYLLTFLLLHFSAFCLFGQYQYCFFLMFAKLFYLQLLL